MVKLLIISITVLLICMIFLCFNIIFRKNGKFPKTHVSQNTELRKRGITCVQSQDFETRHKTIKIKEHQ